MQPGPVHSLARPECGFPRISATLCHMESTFVVRASEKEPKSWQVMAGPLSRPWPVISRKARAPLSPVSGT